MKKTTMVGGHPLTFRFDTSAWLEIEEKFGCLSAMREKIAKGSQPVTTNMEMMVILANCHERWKNGERAKKITLEDLRDGLSPKQINEQTARAYRAVTQGMRRELADDEDEDIDVVAEELAKKAEATSQPGKSSPSD